MLEIVQQTINFYVKNLKTPAIGDLNIENKALLEEKWSFFVTIYLKWEVRWSAGNVKELKENSVLELIESTIAAISQDSRFAPINLTDVQEIKIRVDKITSRQVLSDRKIEDLDPAISGIIAIKKDYSKVACILPNINPKLFIGADMIPVLEEKLREKKFVSDDYIVYEIKTDVETNY